MAVGCVECFRRFLQLILVVVNLIVALLGLAVLILGIWAEVTQKQFFKISDSSSTFLQVPVLLIIIGLLVIIFGIIGAVGGVFASTIFGRIVLGVYAVTLGLLVICEISGGIAAGVKRNNVFDAFRDGSMRTFKEYWNDSSYRTTWNNFQEKFHCCGVNNYTDYKTVFGNASAPDSCCNTTKPVSPPATTCNTTVVANLYQHGCVDTVIDDIKANYVNISITAVVFALLQIVGIVVACFVAIYKHKDNKYEVV